MSNETEAHELLPCPFCGAKAQLFGGPMAHEPYSVWCVASSRHNMVCGGFNKSIAVNAWNTRPDLSDAKDKCIAELEAKLAKAVGALVEINEVAKRAVKLSQKHDEFRLYAMEPMWRATALADTTIAELTGGKDD